MTKRQDSDLRTRAEAKLAQRGKKPPDPSSLSAELEIHRVELQLQNEELRTARDQAEIALGRYTEVFDFAPIGYAVLDAAQQISEINHVGAGLLGVERARLVGKRIVSYAARTGTVALAALLEQARTAGRSVQAEIELLRGHQVWLARVTAAALPRGDATLLVAFDDVTEIKRKEAELARSEHALRDANQHKDEFLAMLSHELRNPLAPIQTCISALRLVEPGSDQATRMLDMMERSAGHLTRLVEDLLDVTRITSGKIQLHRVPVELVGLVAAAVADARLAFDRRRLLLHAQLPDGELWTLGDPVRITQVLNNLLTNAQKFTPDGGQVTVGLALDDGRVVIRVRDTGVGVEPSQIPALFQPFVQAAQSLERSRGGLGLGLAVARGLIELHGGKITMRSDGIGRGTEVAFDLPVDSSSRTVSRDAPGAAPTTPRRILVIEDHPDAAASLQALLALEGHEVQTAADGNAGLALVHTFDPDVVLCDLGLPGMDGFAVARAIRADPALRNRRVVAISGYAAVADVARARSAGFDGHLAKPVTLTGLQAVLASVDRAPS
ncbi:MAG TPA: hybrid sensor histidine kinase/response regulator [Kofleriaceae bacterium]|jgi:two-component system CheB/CheR fusion protein|nr:hybrid sensor histidine kinase/response regulator [Kofleriaceae bacterium]